MPEHTHRDSPRSPLCPLVNYPYLHMPDSNNPFIRFKNHVDNQVSQVWQGIQAQPSKMSGPRDERNHDEQQPIPPGLQEISAERPESHASNNAWARDTLESITEGLRLGSISSWVNFSSYSPLNLQHLPQPSPSDVAADFGGRFNFEDALEDLVAVSSGQTLRDMDRLVSDKRRQEVSRSLRIPGFDSQEWATSLEYRGLWDAYFPRSSFHSGAHSILHELSQLRGHGNWEVERQARAMIRQASMCDEEAKLRGIFRQLQWSHPWGGRLSLGDDSSHELQRAQAELYNPWVKHLEPTNHEDYQATHDAQTPNKPGPDTSEEFSLSFNSRFAASWPPSIPSWGDVFGTRRSWVTLNAQTDGPAGSIDTKTSVADDGSRIVKTTETQEDAGMTRKTVITIRYDPEGNVVRKSVVAHSSATRGNVDSMSDSPSKTETAAEKGSGSNGWFWTRKD
jgi:hypothetical protein